MKFDLNKAIEILSNTPNTLESLLSGLSSEWTNSNEGKDTWSAYDIVGHLIHGEKTDWIPRCKIILSDVDNKTFEPFDRFAQQNNTDHSLEELLATFRELRKNNLNQLDALQLSETDLSKKGMHPDLGEVNLRQLLSSWVVHDLGHIAQIARVFAKQYKTQVGPWEEYIRILSM